jgi:hypothetical protein
MIGELDKYGEPYKNVDLKDIIATFNLFVGAIIHFIMHSHITLKFLTKRNKSC